MDDDDLRRGRPTLHRAFDEATAILAGDALLTFAFEILSRPDVHPDAEVRVKLIGELARAAGKDGMAGGQMLDLEAEDGRSLGLDDVLTLQAMKTGALFRFAAYGRRAFWPAPIRPRSMLTAAPSVLPSRLPTICSMFPPPPPPWARPRRRTRRAGKATFCGPAGRSRRPPPRR